MKPNSALLRQSRWWKPEILHRWTMMTRPWLPPGGVTQEVLGCTEGNTETGGELWLCCSARGLGPYPTSLAWEKGLEESW